MVRRVAVVVLLVTGMLLHMFSPVGAAIDDGRLITLYDRGVKTVFLSDAKTLGEALDQQGISLDARDTVEPLVSEELIATEYHVNIYRARPVVVVDGNTRLKTVSSHQTAQQIAQDAGIKVFDEDISSLKPSTDFIGDGAGLHMSIKRATPLVLDLYGRKTEVRTQAKTVGDMMQEKRITVGDQERVSVSSETPISAGMEVRIWREGQQTVSIDQEIPFASKIVYDSDRPLGYRDIQTAGVPGVRSVTYELEIKDGIEVSKKEIAAITVRNPTDQTEVIGLYNDGRGLTKSKGAQQFVDSRGVAHRETYYDLNMRVVMGSCGQGGSYTVRPDGAKVDGQGYVIIAANYGNYPKCSVVETSLGPGKVYDTGGFAERHPHGFDLATDWTRADGI